MLQMIAIGYDEPAAKGCAKKDRLLFPWHFAKSRSLASLGMTTKCYFSASCEVLPCRPTEFSRRRFRSDDLRLPIGATLRNCDTEQMKKEKRRKHCGGFPALFLHCALHQYAVSGRRLDARRASPRTRRAHRPAKQAPVPHLRRSAGRGTRHLRGVRAFWRQEHRGRQ
jgi:hypothetical protein